MPNEMTEKADIKYKFVFVMQEMTTRFTMIFPAMSETAEETALLAMQVFGIFGVPESLEVHTDGGPGFKSKLMEELVQLMGGKRELGIPDSHQDQAQVERVNEEFWRFLRGLLHDFPTKTKNWYTLLPSVQLIINALPYGNDNIAPADLVLPTFDTTQSLLGMVRSPEVKPTSVFLQELVEASDELVATIEKLIEEEVLRAEATGDQMRTVLTPGQLVLLKPPPDKRNEKRKYQAQGPFEVVSQEKTRVTLKPITGDKKIFDVFITRVIPRVTYDARLTDPVAEAARDDDGHLVEQVLRIEGEPRGSRKNLTVHIRWKGLDEAFDTWMSWKEARKLEAVDDYIRRPENIRTWGHLLQKEKEDAAPTKTVTSRRKPVESAGRKPVERQRVRGRTNAKKKEKKSKKREAEASDEEAAKVDNPYEKTYSSSGKRSARLKKIVAVQVPQIWMETPMPQENPKEFDLFSWRASETDPHDDFDAQQAEAVDSDMLVPGKNCWENAKICRENLSVEQISLIIATLKEFADVGEARLTPARHDPLQLKEIDPSLPASKVPPRRLDQRAEEPCKDYIKRMLDMDIIRPSSSPWNSPILMVDEGLDENQERKWRFCVDLSQCNKRLEKLKAAMPTIESLVKETHKKKFLGKMDLSKYFFQIALSEESKKYTAFTAPDGKRYEFNRCPMGNLNSAQHAQNLSTLAFGFDRAYMDDVLIAGETFEEFLAELRKVLTACRSYNLQVNWSKLHLGFSELDYVGRVVNAEGIKLHPDTVKAVNAWQPPERIRKLMAFLGLCNYCRDFVAAKPPDGYGGDDYFADITRPLYALTGRANQPLSTKIVWTEELLSAFERTKWAISNSIVLHHKSEGRPIYINTDASNVGWGAILYHRNEATNKKEIIHVLSGSFDKTQRRWPTIEQEAFAIFKAVTTWRQDLLGSEFTIYTDHRNLCYILKSESKKISRWRLAMQEFDFTAVHIAGDKNYIADVLSRLYEPSA
jgi:hypothetical protein